MGGFTVIAVAIVAIVVGVVGWAFAPKGPQQTLIRSSILLALTCCYLMWAITYLAQLHPLIQPKRNDVRLEH
ncbi:ATPase, V0 complex, subunit E1/e2 [Cantharellus anzutake]|uniref:ATPase, V0 complex, subunit E1/e2 n=1 Tax=Cantharellus anzutake TaxID=1750568 RepID=UPI0019033F9C|nr:ATPase, V0 complex, subunit E1/e2 [Cantharellus anzutake]KAF8339591.1 ATPase, V0 complex, subunit E1/e2 [Cantharellus anzutake]